jgi:hypothetical protein
MISNGLVVYCEDLAAGVEQNNGINISVGICCILFRGPESNQIFIKYETGAILTAQS